ncbi:M23 family metallopeptidase [Salinivibrio proteolyticus]|uniref:M23 family metallopeptidase n=1 Tax=Salinivibrio proteolyticus TaxID=334715 RepID=UPI0009893BCD|nr:M23 family metallopeptidase [Salinivibrio proteolyticus]OOF28974.1 peptidase M23 [Salinivibrio proteolyticus]
MFRLSRLVLACLMVSTSAAHAHTLIANHTPMRPAAVLEDVGVPDQLVTETDLLFQPRRHPFNIDDFLAEQLPHWQPVSEAIMHWSGASGIDPRILITTLITNAPELEQDITLDRISELKLLQAIEQTASTLSALLYQPNTQTSDATLGHATQTLVSTLHSPSDWQTWQTRYQAWFGDQKPLGQHAISSRSLMAPPAGFMQWPWRQGYAWIPNGPHAHSGSGFPLSSIDVSYDWPQWGGTTYSVTAAHDGYVTVLSRCQVRVTNDNGWATNYYHMDGIQVRNNQWVGKNTKLGTYASQRSVALCQGGSSTGPHLHFSLLKNGRFVSMQDAVLGSYRIQTGRYSYDNDCRYTWLTNTQTGNKVCLWRRITNP